MLQFAVTVGITIGGAQQSFDLGARSYRIRTKNQFFGVRACAKPHLSQKFSFFMGNQIFFWDNNLHETKSDSVGELLPVGGRWWALHYNSDPPQKVTKHYKSRRVSARSIVMHYIFCVPSTVINFFSRSTGGKSPPNHRLRGGNFFLRKSRKT